MKHKIGHLISSSKYAGIEQHINELVSEFQNTDIKATIIADKKIKNHFNNLNFINFANKYRFNPFNIIRLYKILKQNEIQLLHCHGNKSILLGSILKNFLNIKLVATVHAFKSKQQSVKNYDVVIKVNKNINLLHPKTTLVRNWVKPNLSSKISSRDGPFIAIGRLEEVKRFNLLIDAWEEINMPLVIIGEGSKRKYLESLIAKRNLSSRITLTGQLSENQLSKVFESAKGLIITSKHEGGPRVALESLSYQIPVFGSSVGYLAELLSEELLANPEDEKQIIKTIRSCAHNANKIDVREATKNVINKFPLNKAVQIHLKIYDELLSNDL